VSNPNGVLEPGEWAMLAISFWFTPQVGSVVSYSGAGGPGTGELRGFAGAFLDLLGSGDATGTIENLGVDPTWESVNWPQTVAPDGSSVRDIVFGQNPSQNTHIMTANPVIGVYRCTWQPSSYTPRVVEWGLAAGFGGQPSAVFLVTGPTTRVWANCLSTFGTVGIPIVPAPASGAVLVPVAAFAARRRR
jgi:hypothetical protein